MYFIKKLPNYKHVILLSADLLLIPGLFFLEWLSGRMLARPSMCMWNAFGGKCVTCGGTHFVKVLLNGQIIEAFHHNPFLFICTIVLLLSYLLLHLWWLGKVSWAKKLLQKIYSIPGLIVFCSSMILFLLIRNIPVFVRILHAVI